MLAVIGTNTTLLWFLLPLAILLAGVAPAAISFAAGQAAFTLTLVFLFNIIQPAGWRVGLLRVEDIALGCAVSLVVGLLFWPRGAGAALRRALADAYSRQRGLSRQRRATSGRCCCDASVARPRAPAEDAARAAAAARDWTTPSAATWPSAAPSRSPLAEVTSLVTGVAGLRLAADAVLDLWQPRRTARPRAIGAAARQELLQASELVKRWYEDLAQQSRQRASATRAAPPRQRLPTGDSSTAVRRDLRGDDGKASATAVRMIWTGDHLDAVRRLQKVIVGPARVATEQ